MNGSDSNEMSYDELKERACEMALLLRKIDHETRACAMCNEYKIQSYNPIDYVKNICMILFSSEGNYMMKEFGGKDIIIT